MRFLSIRTIANEVNKHKIMGKLFCKAQEQRQMRLLSTRKSELMLLSTRTRAKEVKKHMNNDNWGCQAHEQGQMRFRSTRTNTNEVDKHKIKGK